MNLAPPPEYTIIGFLIFIILCIISPFISKSINSFCNKWSIGNFLFGVLLVGLGIDFLMNPVSYTSRAQYDLRGWLKWAAALSAIFPGVYLIISVKKDKKQK